MPATPVSGAANIADAEKISKVKILIKRSVLASQQCHELVSKHQEQQCIAKFSSLILRNTMSSRRHFVPNITNNFAFLDTNFKTLQTLLHLDNALKFFSLIQRGKFKCLEQDPAGGFKSSKYGCLVSAHIEKGTSN